MPANWFSLRRFFDFSGRASRREFFLIHLMGWVVLFLPILFVMSFVPDTGGPREPFEPGIATIPLMLFGLFYLALEIGVFAAFLAAAFRRVHDHDKSGWFILLGIIPLIGWIFALIWIFTPGDKYENRYGPDPREADLDGVATYEGVFD